MTDHERQGTAGPRVVCDGWEGVHSERRVMSEGSEPVSHGMCADCERAMNYDHGYVDHEQPVLDHEGSEVPRPGAAAAALAAATTAFTWHVCGGCGQRWGDRADDYARCPACLTAGARLLAAAREVAAQTADFENMTDEAAAAMRVLRAVIDTRAGEFGLAADVQPIGACPRCKRADAGEPSLDPLALVCRFCDYIWDRDEPAVTSGVDLASGPDRQVTSAEAIERHDFVAPANVCAKCGGSMFDDVHYTCPLPRKPPQLGMW